MKKNKHNFRLKMKRLAGAVTAFLLSQTALQAQCLNGTQYPSSTIVPVCDGVTYTQIAANNWAGEYAVVAVTAGETYEFKSSIATDYLTISTNGGTSAAAHGVQPLTWVATTTGNVRVYFHTSAACGTQSISRITSVKCGLPPSCQPPTPTATTNIAATTAQLNWTAPATAPANGYEYYYSTSNTAPTAGTAASGAVGAGILTANIGPLSQGTTYYPWIRAVCSSTDKSPWMAGTSFKTETLVAAPWTEGFLTTTSPSGFSFLLSYWYIGTTTGINGNPGNALITNIYGSVPNGEFSTLNVGPLPLGAFLQFDYKNALYNSTAAPAAGAGYVKVYVSTNYGSTYTQIDSFATTTSNAWTPKSYPLAAYTGQNVKIKVSAKWLAEDFNIAFDNLFIGVPPTCNPPVNTSHSNTTQQTADIHWVAPLVIPANGYDYYYSTTSTNPTAATTPSGSVATGISTASLSGLTANTKYYFWVRSNCSAADKSAWTAKDSFTTQLLVPRPWSEEFSTTSVPAGFNTSGWNIGTTNSFGTTPPNYLYKNQYSAATGNAQFTTLNVGAIVATDILKFSYRAGQYYSPYPAPLPGAGYFKVFISTNFGASYTQVDSIPLPGVNQWDSLTYPLSAYAGQNVKVKIESQRNSSVADDYNIAFDNFFIGTPPCTPPTVNLGNDTTICSGTTLTLNAGAASGITHSWSTGATTSSINVTTAGTYSVTASNGNCSASDTIVVNVSATPTVNLGADTMLCNVSTYTLDAGSGNGYTYLWSNSATTQTIDVTTSGQYYVTVTNSSCTGTDTVNVSFKSAPSANGITATANPSPTYNFEANGAQNVSTYLWSFGHNSATANTSTASYTYPSIATEASYTVTLKLTNECGDTTLSTVVDVDPVGINELKLDKNALKLFPNPGSHSVKLINESNYSMKQIIVSNVLGQTVATIPVLNNAQQVIDVNRLPAGLYHVRIEFEEGTVIRKLEVIK